MKRETSRVYLTNEGIIKVEAAQFVTEEDASHIIDQIEDALNKSSIKLKILIDITDVSRAPSSSLFRKTFAKEVKEKIAKHPQWEKTAVFGGGSVVKTIAIFVVGVLGVKDRVNIFDTEKEATAWLK